MTSYDKHYYDGAWQASTGTETIAVISSATEEAIARVPRGTAEDVDRAVKAARRGFESWSRLSVEERAQWLEKLAAAMKTRAPQIAEAIAHEVGTALGYATKVQVEFPIMMIGMNAKFIREMKLEEELGNSIVVKEPVGVVGCVTPWNYPLHQIVCKIAPALCRRLHRGAEARRNGAAQRASSSPRPRMKSACRRASSTSSPAPAAWSAKPSSRIRTSTWSASPARCRRAAASPRSPARASRK